MSNEKQTRGGTRMRERGMKSVQVWLDPREAGLLITVAGRRRMPLARYIRECAVHAAQKAAEEHRKRANRE